MIYRDPNVTLNVKAVPKVQNARTWVCRGFLGNCVTRRRELVFLASARVRQATRELTLEWEISTRKREESKSGGWTFCSIMQRRGAHCTETVLVSQYLSGSLLPGLVTCSISGSRLPFSQTQR